VDQFPGGEVDQFLSGENSADRSLMVVAPEIQLLYKSRSIRPKDTQDLATCMPHLSAQAVSTLRAWIALDSGDHHPWLALLA
jgi:hypothetical protein